MATLIECIKGPATTQVGNEVYSFEKDEAGRFVAHVNSIAHIEILTGLAGVYRKALPIPATAMPEPKPAEVPVKDEDRGKGKNDDPPKPDDGDKDPDDTNTNDGVGQGAGDGVTPPAEPDDLTRIDGIGELTAKKLAGKDITTFAQLAALTDADLAKLDEELELRGLAARSDWVGQAKALSQKQ